MCCEVITAAHFCDGEAYNVFAEVPDDQCEMFVCFPPTYM